MRFKLGFITFLLIITSSGCVRPVQKVTIKIDSKTIPKAQYYIPLKKMKILSRFGPRDGWYHTGLDIRNKRGGGDHVLASRAGKVIKVGTGRGYGKMIVLKHKDGYKTRYAHLKKYKVKIGQTVRALDPIGVVGQTGRATAPHLHFEIMTPSGRFMDPERILLP